MALIVGSLAFVLGVRAGLKGSPEVIVRISILVQLTILALPLIMVLITGIRGRTSVSRLLQAVQDGLMWTALAAHLLNAVLVYSASARNKPYPWRVLRWTFPVGALGFCLPTIVSMARGAGRALSASACLFWAITLLPSVLQTALLWWPRLDPATAEETSDAVG